MGAIANAIGNLGKPLILGILLLVGLGLLSEDPRAGHLGASGFDCRGFTNDPDLNRAICRYSPARLWNMPITELVPWLAPASSGQANN